MYTIYGLQDPRDGNIFYVGKSQNAWSRYNSHLYADNTKHRKCNKQLAAVLDSFSFACVPRLIKLDNCEEREEAIKLEHYWIWQIKSWGFNICNMRLPGAKPPRKVKKLKMVHVSQDIMDNIFRNMTTHHQRLVCQKNNITWEAVRIAMKKGRINSIHWDEIKIYYKGELPHEIR